ncbi:MAG: efflux RND transporter periplasmic adaptor subunit [bacterium]
MISKIYTHAISHKLGTAIVIALVAGGIYFGYTRVSAQQTPVQYLTAKAQKGMIVNSISGSGQISAVSQVDIKPKISGDIIYVNTTVGQEVKAGQLLFQIDATDAQKSLRDAETALETAKLDLAQAEEDGADSLVQSEDDLKKNTEDGFNSVVGYFYDLPSVVMDMEGVLYGKDINKSQDNIDAYADMLMFNYEAEILKYKNSAAESYDIARKAYDKNFKDYKETSRYAESEVIIALIDETYDTAKKISEAIRNADNFTSFVKDKLVLGGLDMPKILATHQNTIKTDTSKANNILSGLVSAERAIKNSREAIEKIKNNDNNLTLRSKNLSIHQKEDALASARQALADCFVRAPFDGVVAKINIKKGDSVSSGTALASLITKQKIISISLTEADIVKVKTGQLATLSFDAVDNLTLTGKVYEVDMLGTASQSIVTYGVKISIDADDERIKSGMTANAAIIIDKKDTVLLVPNSAVQIKNGEPVVEILQNGAPVSISVETGLSNDASTEIISGINEGDEVVTGKTGGAAVKTPAVSGNNLFRMGSGGGGEMGGGATFRAR